MSFYCQYRCHIMHTFCDWSDCKCKRETMKHPNPLAEGQFIKMEPHLSGYVLVIGFASKEDCHRAMEHVAKMHAAPSEREGHQL